MTPVVSVKTITCPDPNCINGKIVVHNAYSSDPLVGEEQECDTCGGKSYIILENVSNN